MAKTRYFAHKGNRYILEREDYKEAQWMLMRPMGERLYGQTYELLASSPSKTKLISMIKSGEIR